jgi:hypothetical protein
MDRQRHGKYRLLFSAKRRTRPGPKGPSADLIYAVIEMKQRNPRWGCPRIAEQIASAFGIDDAVITPAEREQRKHVHQSAKAATLVCRTASKQLTPDELNTFTRHIEKCVERYAIKKQ